MSPRLPSTPWPEPEDGETPAPRIVRHFTLTSGRARTTVEIPLEATLRRLSVVEEGRAAPAAGGIPERILEACDTKSLADLSSELEMGIGVLRVLVGDLVEHGHIRIQSTITTDSSIDERRDLIERTLRGLRSL
jgi:hypothetical protein